MSCKFIRKYHYTGSPRTMQLFIDAVLLLISDRIDKVALKLWLPIYITNVEPLASEITVVPVMIACAISHSSFTISFGNCNQGIQEIVDG